MSGSTSSMNQAILRKIAEANATGGNVSLEQPVTDYAAGKSAADADALKFATDLNFKNKALAQQGAQSTATLAQQNNQFTGTLAQDEKQFLTRLLAARDDLATWSRQNDLATLISATNIPVSGFAAYKQSERQDKQDETVKTILDMDKANSADRIAAARSENALTLSAIAKLMEGIKPPVQTNKKNKKG